MSRDRGYFFESSVCSVFVTAGEGLVRRVVLLTKDTDAKKMLKKESCTIDEFPLPDLIAGLKKYFAREYAELEFSCDLSALTPLEREILSIVRNIPYAKTMTYEEVAKQAGNLNLRRVVGRTVAKNPCPIIIPCHRVLGKGGRLTGFSADGGVSLKKELLNIEKML